MKDVAMCMQLTKVLIWFYLFLYIICHHNPDDTTTIVQHVDVPPVPLHPPKFLPLLAVPDQTTGNISDDSVTAYSKRHDVYHACKHAHGIIFHSHSQTSHSRRERTSLHQLQQVSWNDGHVWDSMIQHKMFPLFMQIPQSRQKGASLWFQWTKIPVH